MNITNISNSVCSYLPSWACNYYTIPGTLVAGLALAFFINRLYHPTKTVVDLKDRQTSVGTQASQSTASPKVEQPAPIIREIIPIDPITPSQWANPSTFKLPPYPPELQAFLDGPCPIMKNCQAKETHIVLPLIRSLDFYNQDLGQSFNYPLNNLQNLNFLDYHAQGEGITCPTANLDVFKRETGDEYTYAVISKKFLPRENDVKRQNQIAKDLGYDEMAPAFETCLALLWAQRNGGDLPVLPDDAMIQCKFIGVNSSLAKVGIQLRRESQRSPPLNNGLIGLKLGPILASSNVHGALGFKKF